MIVRGLGSVLAGKGKCAGVERRIIQSQADSSGVERPAALTVVAEGRRLRKRRCSAIVHAAVDRENISGGMVEIARGNSGAFVAPLRGIARCVYVGLVKRGFRLFRCGR